MVMGQALDIAAETAPAPLTLDQITALQAGKTGALIRWSAEAGAMGGADPAPLGAYAAALGLAFQIADDILDARATRRRRASAWARMRRQARRPSCRCWGSTARAPAGARLPPRRGRNRPCALWRAGGCPARRCPLRYLPRP
jgi:hypothetical protein